MRTRSESRLQAPMRGGARDGPGGLPPRRPCRGRLRRTRRWDAHPPRQVQPCVRPRAAGNRARQQFIRRDVDGTRHVQDLSSPPSTPDQRPHIEHTHVRLVEQLSELPRRDPAQSRYGLGHSRSQSSKRANSALPKFPRLQSDRRGNAVSEGRAGRPNRDPCRQNGREGSVSLRGPARVHSRSSALPSALRRAPWGPSLGSFDCRRRCTGPA